MKKKKMVDAVHRVEKPRVSDPRRGGTIVGSILIWEAHRKGLRNRGSKIKWKGRLPSGMGGKAGVFVLGVLGWGLGGGGG